MTASSALVPVSLVIIPDGWWQKSVASLLAASAVIVGTWVQIERPHERWVLYRRYQRMLEADQLRFRFRNAPYQDPVAASQELAKRIAQLQLDLHDEWEGIVPSSRDASRAAQGGAS
jgi:hypothetical protein